MSTALAALHYRGLYDEARIKDYEKHIRSFAQQWIEAGTAFGGGYGYGKLTPYMHALVRHVPDQLRILGSLAIVSCQSTSVVRVFVRVCACVRVLVRFIAGLHACV
jgi:hypothetical protein